jgi:hypothetical protein
MYQFNEKEVAAALICHSRKKANLKNCWSRELEELTSMREQDFE